MDYQRILYSEISFVPHKQQIATNNYDLEANSSNNVAKKTTNNDLNINSNIFYSKSNTNFNVNGKNVNDKINTNGINGTISTTSTPTNDKSSIPSSQVNHNNNNNNNEGFQAPKHQLCDPSLIKLDWPQSEKIGGGLINCGNTCFLNSVLQCLTYCPPLYNYLVKLNGGHSNTCKINQFCMLCEMEKHIKRIKGSNGTPIKPNSIVQRLKYINKSFQFGRQEDAHEFLRYIIDHMVKACLINLDINCKTTKLDPRIKETTFINHIFGGYHRSQVLCLTCNSRSNTYDFFMDFILDIKNAKSLEDSLRKFTQPETLENENAYKCGKCRKKVTARKRFSVFRAPNVATFQLKRFEADRIFGGKLTKFVSYPEELDLRPYMSESSKVPIKYLLSAVLVHVGGSTNSGHYYCYIKNSNGFWYRMDDSYVSVVNKSVVLQQQAYVLFYTKKPSDIQKPIPSNGLVHDKNSLASTLNGTSNITKNTLNNNNSASTINSNLNGHSNNNNATKPTIHQQATSKTDSAVNTPKPAPVGSDPKATSSGVAPSTLPPKSEATKATDSSTAAKSDIKPNSSSAPEEGTSNITTSPAKGGTILATPSTSTIKQTQKPTFLETWLGAKSKLSDEDLTSKRKNESTARDRFNEELDQGKVKKIKTQTREERFSNLAKLNPFQRFTSNGFQQHSNNGTNGINKSPNKHQGPANIFHKLNGRHNNSNDNNNNSNGKNNMNAKNNGMFRHSHPNNSNNFRRHDSHNKNKFNYDAKHKNRFCFRKQ